MPIEVTRLDDGLGVRIVGKGIITAEEYMEVLTQHLTEPEEQLKRYLYSLSDYIDTDKFEGNLAHITKIAHKSIEAGKVNPHAIVVIILPNDILYSITKIWCALAKLSGWKMSVFKSREEGENWLKAEMDRKYPELDLKYTA